MELYCEWLTNKNRSWSSPIQDAFNRMKPHYYTLARMRRMNKKGWMKLDIEPNIGRLITDQVKDFLASIHDNNSNVPDRYRAHGLDLLSAAALGGDQNQDLYDLYE